MQPIRHCSIPVRETSPRRGFTLVEALLVIAIIGVMAGMSLVVLADAANSAKISRTKVQIRKINDQIMARWEEFESRPIPFRLDTSSNSALNNARDAARVRLCMLRAIMRMELPERMSDIIFVDSAVDPTADVTPADLLSLTDYYFIPTNAIQVPMNTGAPFQLPARAFRNSLNDFYYQEVFRSVQVFASVNGRNMTWGELLSNQSAECLYLIMKSIQDEYGNALDAFADTEIGDFDNDGLMEIHDPWGTPIAFQRWAPGLSEFGIQSTSQKISPIQSGVSQEDPDPFDPLLSDVRFFDVDYLGLPAEKVDNDSFRLVPLIYSAGPDRKFDIWTRDEFDRSAFDGGDRLVNYSFPSPELGLVNDPYWGWGLESDTVPSVGYRMDVDNNSVEEYYDNIDNHFGLED